MYCMCTIVRGELTSTLMLFRLVYYVNLDSFLTIALDIHVCRMLYRASYITRLHLIHYWMCDCRPCTTINLWCVCHVYQDYVKMDLSV